MLIANLASPLMFLLSIKRQRNLDLTSRRLPCDPQTKSFRQPAVGVEQVYGDGQPLLGSNHHHPPERIGQQAADGANDLRSPTVARHQQKCSDTEYRNADLGNCKKGHRVLPARLKLRSLDLNTLCRRAWLLRFIAN